MTRPPQPAARAAMGPWLMVVLLSGAPAMAMMFTVLGPVLPSLMQQFAAWGDGALVAQLVMTMPSIGIVLAGAPVGWLVERHGAATVLKLALFCFGLAGAAGWVLDSLPLFLATRLVVGFAASGIATAALALAAEFFEADQRARVLSYQTAAGSAAGLVSLLCAGALAESWGWRAPFGLYLLAWGVLLCAWLALPAARAGVAARAVAAEPAPFAGADTGAAAEPAVGLAALRPLWPLYALIVVVFIAVFMGAVQLSFLLAADGIVSPAVQSWVLAAGSVGNALGALSYGWLRPRLGARGVYALALLCLGLGNLALGLTVGVPWKVLASALAAAGAGAVGPYLVNLLIDRATPAVRGRAAGLVYSATFIGDFLNPLAVAPLRLALGIHAAFIAVGALCVLGALWAFWKPPQPPLPAPAGTAR